MAEHSIKKNTRSKVIGRIAAAVFVICVIALIFIGYIYLHQSQYYGKLADDSVTESDDLASMTVDWDSLRATNPDIVAWIVMPDTNINYPVVKSSDNEDYLHKSFDGASGVMANAGTIFMDCNNASDLSDKNIGLYGHNMRDGSMFAQVASLANQDEYSAHRVFYVLTPYINYEVTTFSLVLTNGSDEIVQTSFATDDDYVSYLKDKVERSVVSSTDPSVEIGDTYKSFLLSTCEYSQTDGRAVLFGAVTDSAKPKNS